MATLNHYTEKLKQEQEQEKFSELLPKKFFDIRDFDKLAETKVSPRTLLRELEVRDEPLAVAERLVDDLLSDKLQLLEQTIQDINQELHLRKNMVFQAHSEMEQEIQELSNYLTHLQLFGMDRGTSIVKANTRTQITQLQKEKRQNVAFTWRDITHLRQNLRDSIEKYQSLLRTKTLLEI